MEVVDLVIIGGGAAGTFAAIAAKESIPQSEVLLLEKSDKLLTKVLRSGGGRCNLTNSDLSSHNLSQFYPRGAKELRGPFHRFGAADTISWFTDRGVILITEDRGRVFPATHSSQTIVSCLTQELKRTGIEVRLRCQIDQITNDSNIFSILLCDGQIIRSHSLILATGSSPFGFACASHFGHTVIKPVPSLFSFVCKERPACSGVSVDPVEIRLLGTKYVQQGSLLITHTGLSGPVILQLSSFGARYLAEHGYRAELSINWIPSIREEAFIEHFLRLKSEALHKQLSSTPLFSVPKTLWRELLSKTGLSESRLVNFSLQQIRKVYEHLRGYRMTVNSAAANGEEFVTCGGVDLAEINWTTMESKKCPGLFIVGELLDVDGITGGFNLQNAWTTGYLAGKSIQSV